MRSYDVNVCGDDRELRALYVVIYTYPWLSSITQPHYMPTC